MLLKNKMNDFDDEDMTNALEISEDVNRSMRIPRMIGAYCVANVLQETKSSVVLTTLKTESNNEYVIKCIPYVYFIQNKYGNELKFMKELDHPHIIKAVNDYIISKDEARFIAIVMHRANRDLFRYLYSDYKILSELTSCKIISDVLEALSYLHERGIWHRDVKLENILIIKETEEGPFAVLGDFGLACNFGFGFREAEAVGTINYAAPELIEKDINSIDFKCRWKKKVSCLFNYSRF